MKRVLSFLLFSLLVAGIVWYESRPTTVAVPVDYEEPYYPEDLYLEETTIAVVETTQPARPEVDFSTPDLTLEIRGVDGDSIDIVEVVSEPQRLDQLPEDVRSALMGCPGVTDRDMAVQVDSKLQLNSALDLELSVDYRTTGNPAVFEFNEGLTCDDGSAKHTMHPGSYNHLTYWVALTGAVTPDYPEGDFVNNSWSITAPVVVLPNFQQMHWQLWGPRVVSCDGLLGDSAKVWLAGVTPADGQQDCSPVTDIRDAVGAY